MVELLIKNQVKKVFKQPSKPHKKHQLVSKNARNAHKKNIKSYEFKRSFVKPLMRARFTPDIEAIIEVRPMHPVISLDELDKLLTDDVYDKLKVAPENEHLAIIGENTPNASLTMCIYIKSAFEIRNEMDKDFMKCVDEVLKTK